MQAVLQRGAARDQELAQDRGDSADVDAVGLDRGLAVDRQELQHLRGAGDSQAARHAEAVGDEQVAIDVRSARDVRAVGADGQAGAAVLHEQVASGEGAVGVQDDGLQLGQGASVVVPGDDVQVPGRGVAGRGPLQEAAAGVVGVALGGPDRSRVRRGVGVEVEVARAERAPHEQLFVRGRPVGPARLAGQVRSGRLLGERGVARLDRVRRGAQRDRLQAAVRASQADLEGERIVLGDDLVELAAHRVADLQVEDVVPHLHAGDGLGAQHLGVAEQLDHDRVEADVAARQLGLADARLEGEHRRYALQLDGRQVVAAGPRGGAVAGHLLRRGGSRHQERQGEGDGESGKRTHHHSPPQ